VKIHALQTGTVRVKPSQRVGRRRDSIRQFNIPLDRSRTELLPIYAWAIETVDGLIIVDTGETTRTREPGYFPIGTHTSDWRSDSMSLPSRWCEGEDLNTGCVIVHVGSRRLIPK